MAKTFNYDQNTKKATQVAEVRDTNTPADKEGKTMGALMTQEGFKKAQPPYQRKSHKSPYS